MADKKTYIDIDDFGNTENIIKKIDPSFNDIPSKMPAPVANFAQQQMSLTIRVNKQSAQAGGMKPHHRYILFNKGK